jgi:hypothetical protein
MLAPFRAPARACACHTYILEGVVCVPHMHVPLLRLSVPCPPLCVKQQQQQPHPLQQQVPLSAPEMNA